jgi:putative ABC transport system permease protein
MVELISFIQLWDNSINRWLAALLCIIILTLLFKVFIFLNRSKAHEAMKALVKSFFQLIILGLVLESILKQDKIFLTISILLFLILMATYFVRKRLPFARGDAHFLLNNFIIFLLVTPLHGMIGQMLLENKINFSAQTIVPLMGMILGNSLNGLIISYEFFEQRLTENKQEIEFYLAMGASPFESIKFFFSEAFVKGISPIINSLSIVGIVSLPGMMTGQILAGASSLQAAIYQFVIMLLVFLSISCCILIGLYLKANKK